MSQSLLKFVSIELVMPFNHLILCHSFLLLPSVFPSIRVFSMSLLSASCGQSTGASVSEISPSNEYSGLVSFRIHWFDFLAVHGSLKNLLQHNSKALIFRHSVFFMVQLSHPYMTTGKLICCSVAQSRPTLCKPTDCSMPGLPVLHYLPVCPNSCPLNR